MSSVVDLKQAVQHLDSLPAMPIIAQKLLGLNLDTDEGEREMLRLIEQDPLISAKIIGLANTPLFGPSKRVSSTKDSAMLLGITRVKAVAMGIAVMTAMIKKPMGKLNIQGLWLHSMAISLALRILSKAMPREKRPLEDEIFLAGLLHDIGFLVLNQLDQKRSDELHYHFAAEPDRPAGEIEAEMLELNHCELGAELARYWDLPEALIALIRYHHVPNSELAAVAQPLVSMVGLADKILANFGFSENSKAPITEEEWLFLGIDPAQEEEIIAQILQKAEEAKQTAAMF